MTPEQLLTRPVQYVTAHTRWLWGCYFSHVPEIDGYACPRRGLGVTLRVYKHHDFDLWRVWLLASVHIDEAPVMIIRCAGRGGDDHASRYVFDVFHYRAMVERLGRKPSERRRGPKPERGWQWSLRHPSPTDDLMESTRADEFYGRHLDSPPDHWRLW